MIGVCIRRDPSLTYSAWVPQTTQKQNTVKSLMAAILPRHLLADLLLFGTIQVLQLMLEVCGVSIVEDVSRINCICHCA